jgi:hypothetical protein
MQREEEECRFATYFWGCIVIAKLYSVGTDTLTTHSSHPRIVPPVFRLLWHLVNQASNQQRAVEQWRLGETHTPKKETPTAKTSKNK